MPYENETEKLFYRACMPRKAIEDARAWLLDLFSDEDDVEKISLLNHVGIIKAVERYYSGGYIAFLRDADNLKEITDLTN